MMCPHGDPMCPCPDGLACHYEGDRTSTDPAVRPMPCPSMLPGQRFGAHCHVEGCTWTATEIPGCAGGPTCGLRRLGMTSMTVRRNQGCGAVRNAVACGDLIIRSD